MNVLITLPRHLLDKILAGEKLFEMRKSVPRKMVIGQEGFFVVEKGTDQVRCWCRVDEIIECRMTEIKAAVLSSSLCVSPEFIINYAPVGKKVFLWHIDIVIQLHGISRTLLLGDTNPQSYAYTQWTI